MKIAISQREINLRNSVGEILTFDAMERAWARLLQGHDMIAVPNLVNVKHLDFDCLILTGGPDSVARHMTEDALYALALERQCPIIGVCHGAFVINDLAGGVNGVVQGHEGTTHDIVLEGTVQKVNSYHSQCIEKLAPNFIATGVDPQDMIESFEHKTRPIYGIVWHPERQHTPVWPQAVGRLLGPGP